MLNRWRGGIIMGLIVVRVTVVGGSRWRTIIRWIWLYMLSIWGHRWCRLVLVGGSVRAPIWLRVGG